MTETRKHTNKDLDCFIAKKHTKKGLDCFIVICSPQESLSIEGYRYYMYKELSLREFDFVNLIKSDSLFIRRTNAIVIIPSIQADIGALLFDTFFKARNQTEALAQCCIGISYRQHIAFCYNNKLDSFLNVLIKKYVSDRETFFLKFEEIINFTDGVPKNIEDEFTNDLSDPVISLKQDWFPLHLSVKYKEQEKLKIATKHVKKRQFEEILREEEISYLKVYLKNDRLIQYGRRKQKPSVGTDKPLVAKQQIETGFKDITVSDGGQKEKTDFKTPKVLFRKRKKRKSDAEYRKSCPEFTIYTDIFNDGKQGIFSDPENLDSLTDLEKNVSIKEFHEKHGDLPLEIRKDLQEITNLPLRQFPVRRQDIIAYPGGRKKKGDRPTERRQQQRNPAQNQPYHAQPTDDDPIPESLYALSRDRLALPSQPEQRNLQHLVSSFTPRVEPISAASTQQLRRLATRPRHPQYEQETARRESFNDWPSNTGQNPENMVTNGFFYTGRVDLIRCYMCGIGLKDWSSDDEPLFEHVRHSPDCPFLFNFLGQDVLDAYKAALLPGRAQPSQAREGTNPAQGSSNLTEGAPLAPGGGNPAPRNREYEELRQRIESFTNWPRTITQTPRQLAEAGFFYTGEDDTVRCFHCDGGLRRWDPRDDPWIEHTRWFPHCPYVRQIKGLEYVDLVQRAIRESATEDDDPMVYGDTVSGAMANLTVQPPVSREPEEPAVTPQTILDMGYSRQALTEAMKKAEERGTVNYTPQDLLEILLELGSAGQLTPPEPRPQASQDKQASGVTSAETEDDPLFVTIENKSLRKVLKCSECKIRDKNMLFLPCTHHSLCEECAEKATKCPVCDSEISRKIKTYMS